MKKFLIVILLLLVAISFSGCASVDNNYSSTSSDNVEDVDISKAKVEVASHSIQTSSYGSKHIVGEVINNGDADASFVKVTATFYDKNETVVDTDFTYAGDTSSTALQPQMKAPFKIYADSNFDHYKLDVTWN